MPSIILPDPSLVLLVGPSGAGKSTFAARHFRPTEILSSDAFRAMIADDERDQSVSGAAFSILHQIARARLARRHLTVIDATNLERRARRPLLRLARLCRLPVIAIVFNLTLDACLRHNLQRSAREVPAEIIAEQFADLQKARARLRGEGYAAIYELDETNLAGMTIERRADHPDPVAAAS